MLSDQKAKIMTVKQVILWRKACIHCSTDACFTLYLIFCHFASICDVKRGVTFDVTLQMRITDRLQEVGTGLKINKTV